jgi:hypothetical protein
MGVGIFLFGTEARRTVTVLLLATIVIVSGVASALVFLRGPISSAGLKNDLIQPNVPLTCQAGTFVANHSCVSNCPAGFRPVTYDAARSPICMSQDNTPVSVYDLAGSWVSGDGGLTRFFIVETVPLAKLPQIQSGTVSVWLPVSQGILDSLPTVPKVPTVTTLVATIGDHVDTFTIQYISPNYVKGDFYDPWPLCCRHMNLTISVGNDVGISCEGISIILESINVYDQIAIFQKTMISSPNLSCPICLSGDTTIGTPNGPVNVKSITVGTPVWTVDRFGRKVAGTVIEVRKNPVPSSREVVHIILQDGRQLYASPAHPTADGRTFGELMAGGILDNSVIAIAEPVQYNQPYTYDLLPSGDTGFYWANSILVGSTLSPT